MRAAFAREVFLVLQHSNSVPTIRRASRKSSRGSYATIAIARMVSLRTVSRSIRSVRTS